MAEEIKNYRETRFIEEPVQTVYIGGGTPSLMTRSHLEAIFKALNETFDLQTEETTIELNPDDVTVDYLESLKKLGIDRASMGIQTFQPKLLTFMNRAHDRMEAIESLKKLEKAGFKTYSVDIIYGNPGQTVRDLEQDLELLLKFEPPHISAYSLTVEPRTRLGKQVELGRILPPDDEQVADHMNLVTERLAEAKITRYEVSNFAKTGYEAVHNSSYWTHKNYLGFGPAAHSFWWDHNAYARRWENEKDLRKYLYDPESFERKKEQLDLSQLAEERIMMGLRTKRGLNSTELKERYDFTWSERQKEYLDRKQSEGKVRIGLDGTVNLTHEGMNLADAVTLDLLTLD